MPDHVHLAVSRPPTDMVAAFIRDLKGSSSHLVNHPDRRPVSFQEFAWQAEYGVVSFGEASLPTIVAYVENQRQHHADQQLIQIYDHLERPYNNPARSN
jgi:putative transposase